MLLPICLRRRNLWRVLVLVALRRRRRTLARGPRSEVASLNAAVGQCRMRRRRRDDLSVIFKASNVCQLLRPFVRRLQCRAAAAAQTNTQRKLLSPCASRARCRRRRTHALAAAVTVNAHFKTQIISACLAALRKTLSRWAAAALVSERARQAPGQTAAKRPHYSTLHLPFGHIYASVLLLFSGMLFARISRLISPIQN